MRSRHPPFITQLCYVNTHLFICQELFSSFCKFLFVSRRSRGQLAYISTPHSICQALFNKNLISFLCTFTHTQPSTIDGLPPSAYPFANPLQGICRIHTGLLRYRQIPQAHHPAKSPVFQHRQPPHLGSSHDERRCIGIHVRPY